MSETPRDHELKSADWDAMRAAAPQPGPDLLARIAADAARLQPQPKRGWRDRLAASLGAFADFQGTSLAVVLGLFCSKYLTHLSKSAVTVLYETFRAFVVTKLTLAAAAAIPPSEFSFPVFGPIFCGTIAGCGGAFLPLDKGLDPIKDGLAPPMFSAFVGATFFHLFTQLATDVMDAKKKGKVIVAFWFIMYAFYKNG